MSAVIPGFVPGPDIGTEKDRLIEELNAKYERLLQSNKELEEHMAENGNDKTLRDAIGENIVIVARYRAIVEDLEKGAPVSGTTHPIPTREPMDTASGGSPQHSGGGGSAGIDL
jgi:hypothetical protein